MSVSADTAILGLVSTPRVEPRNTLYYRRRLPISGVCFGVCALLPHSFIVLKYDPDPAHKLIFDKAMFVPQLSLKASLKLSL